MSGLWSIPMCALSLAWMKVVVRFHLKHLPLISSCNYQRYIVGFSLLLWLRNFVATIASIHAVSLVEEKLNLAADFIWSCMADLRFCFIFQVLVLEYSEKESVFVVFIFKYCVVSLQEWKLLLHSQARWLSKKICCESGLEDEDYCEQGMMFARDRFWAWTWI